MKKIIIIILIATSLIFAQPKTSAWSGVALCIKHYLNDNLKDPESLKIRNVSAVIESSGLYCQRVNYTAKNSYGGNTRSNKVFIIDKINGYYKVISHYDFKQ